MAAPVNSCGRSNSEATTMRRRIFFAFTRTCSRNFWQNSERVITRILSPSARAKNPSRSSGLPAIYLVWGAQIGGNGFCRQTMSSLVPMTRSLIRVIKTVQVNMLHLGIPGKGRRQVGNRDAFARSKLADPIIGVRKVFHPKPANELDALRGVGK